MIAGVKYYVLVTARKQAVLAPVITFLAIVAMVYATDAGPPLAAATVPAAALVPVGAWMMRLVATSESRAFADVTLVALGSEQRRQFARGLAAVLYGALLCVIATAWARIANPHPYPAPVIAIIFVMSFVLVVAGIGLGSLLAPPLGVTAGAAAMVVTVVVLVSLVARFVPPIHPVLDAYLAHRGSRPIALIEAFALGVAMFGVALRLGRRAR